MKQVPEHLRGGKNNRLTRETRIARQKYDDGDPDDTVYVNCFNPDGGIAARDSKIKQRRGEVYHDDHDCQYLNRHDTPDHREYTREGAQLRWLAPCLRCVLGITD